MLNETLSYKDGRSEKMQAFQSYQAGASLHLYRDARFASLLLAYAASAFRHQRQHFARAVERFYPPSLAIAVFVSPQSVIH